jgi:hypothetical protein
MSHDPYIDAFLSEWQGEVAPRKSVLTLLNETNQSTYGLIPDDNSNPHVQCRRIECLSARD